MFSVNNLLPSKWKMPNIFRFLLLSKENAFDNKFNAFFIIY